MWLLWTYIFLNLSRFPCFNDVGISQYISRTSHLLLNTPILKWRYEHTLSLHLRVSITVYHLISSKTLPDSSRYSPLIHKYNFIDCFHIDASVTRYIKCGCFSSFWAPKGSTAGAQRIDVTDKRATATAQQKKARSISQSSVSIHVANPC